jgi:hypothetical protein
MNICSQILVLVTETEAWLRARLRFLQCQLCPRQAWPDVVEYHRFSNQSPDRIILVFPNYASRRQVLKVRCRDEVFYRFANGAAKFEGGLDHHAMFVAG